MGLLDKFKKSADDAKDAVAEHSETIDKGIDKAADLIDDKTGNAHTDKIDAVADKAKDVVDGLADEK